MHTTAREKTLLSRLKRAPLRTILWPRFLCFLLAIPFQKAENSIYFPTDLCLPIDFPFPRVFWGKKNPTTEIKVFFLL